MACSEQPTPPSRWVTLVIILAVLAVGGLTMQKMGANMEPYNQAAETRAMEVYNEPVTTISSDNCWDYCSQTAVPEGQPRQDILQAADNADGWVTVSALYDATPGMPKDTLDQLVAEGVLEERNTGFWAGATEYRYVGADGKHEGRLSETALETRLTRQLYVMQAWVNVDELASSVPASDARVRAALYELKADGEVQQDTQDLKKVFADTSVDHSPASHGPFSLWKLLLLVLAAVVVISIVQRFRGDSSDSE